MNLNETMQKIFETVVASLIQQGKPSVQTDWAGEISHCTYRGRDGAKCAIGWLIADDRYSLSFEHNGVIYVMERLNWMPNPKLDLTEFREDRDLHAFLGKLQYCHDLASDSTDFVKRFKQECIELLSPYVCTTALQD